MKVTPHVASLAALLAAQVTLATPTSAGTTPTCVTPPIPALPHTAQEVIAKLNLTANPEKGYFVESFRDPDNATIVTSSSSQQQQRSFSTAIYYLLEGREGDSVWHRVDAVEVWHYYAGAPLTLSLSYDDGAPVARRVLGPDIFAADGQRPQVAIGKLQWQSARSHGDWTLLGTTVAPGFTDSGVELAAPGWKPKGA
ncbi:RmlC-like cupin domain-containing protein [Apiospora marii]|uniref:RmlC-like cupin domain-containing protein n=1 Tax=Apiospora marii TaxID=335849 RepID=A0ABR1T251_9PEZI